MRRIGILSAVTAAAAIVAMAPLPASAAPAAPNATSLADCHTGLVEALVNGNLYSGWNSFNVIGHYSQFTFWVCDMTGTPVHIGRRYSACDEIGGNGWIGLFFGQGQEGYVPQACFADIPTP